MNVSDVVGQVVALQTQMLQNSVALAAAKAVLDQQQVAATLLTESSQQISVASADGRGAMLDILV
mgnify:FL=1